MTIPPSSDSPIAHADEIVVPLYAEDVVVERRKVERPVQVNIRTITRDQLIDEILTHEKVEIERVPIGRRVDTAPAVREEGHTTVIPIVEEVLVVERRLVLKEEIRLRRVQTTERHRETVTLREQEAVVERSGPNGHRSGSRPDLASIPQPQAVKEE